MVFGLHRAGRVLLGDEMGLGKTLQVPWLARGGAGPVGITGRFLCFLNMGNFQPETLIGDDWWMIKNIRLLVISAEHINWLSHGDKVINHHQLRSDFFHQLGYTMGCLMANSLDKL